uniref:PSI domain-containing protein n=1 Tax=Heterorhabditis bacteriophora TaxID=37862 RepID=A0A1I7X6L5_HETBA
MWLCIIGVFLLFVDGLAGWNNYQDLHVTSRGICEFDVDESRTCETCTAKGSECFWCGDSTKTCLPYAWYFPNCDLSNVRHKHCWVNLSAVVIVLCILGGIILVILIACLCYCCFRWRNYNRKQANKKGEKWNFQQALSRMEMQNRHSLRTEQRQRELEAYRLKYGLPSKVATTAEDSCKK